MLKLRRTQRDHTQVATTVFLPPVASEAISDVVLPLELAAPTPFIVAALPFVIGTFLFVQAV